MREAAYLPVDAAPTAKAPFRVTVRAQRALRFAGLLVLLAAAKLVHALWAAHEGGAEPGHADKLLPSSPSSALVRLHSSPALGAADESLGLLRSEFADRCLGPSSGGSGLALEPCKDQLLRSKQLWAQNAHRGLFRSVFSNGQCLSLTLEGLGLGLRTCNYTEGTTDADQAWKLNEDGYIVDSNGMCLGALVDGSGPSLSVCDFQSSDSMRLQKWKWVGIDHLVEARALESGRDPKSVKEESARRKVTKIETPGLLTLEDVARGLDPSTLLGGSFWGDVEPLFSTMKPGWRRWKDLFAVGKALTEASPTEEALGTAYLVNIVSNMVFAGMNFVQGFDGPDLNVWDTYKLVLKNFIGNSTSRCHARVEKGWGAKWIAVCEWRRAVDGEHLDMASFRESIDQDYGGSLLQGTFLDQLFTGKRMPSWEDNAGVAGAFALLDRGIGAARSHGKEPATLVRSASDVRFAFDSEGLASLVGEGFGWFTPREVRFASDGNSGAVALEKLVQEHGGKDVLGALMTDSTLSMHLEFDGEQLFVDLTMFQRCKPLEGFAPLGGRAYFKEVDGRLVTSRLEYSGRVFTSFDDHEADRAFAESRLSGWRFAQAAIIASLIAKTQLMVHVGFIHLELAPAVQAVTVDAFADVPEHPLRRMLMPFIHRSVQAARSNVKLWFHYRAGEFGLAPLPVEEQLLLLHNARQRGSFNLAELDMEFFARARGMERFTAENVHASATGGEWANAAPRWHWRWHERALAVQRRMQDLLVCWLTQHYSGESASLRGDTALQAWWASMMEHVPSLQVAADTTPDWLVRKFPPGGARAAPAAATPAPAAEPVGATGPVPGNEMAVRRRLRWGFDRNGNFGEIGSDGLAKASSVKESPVRVASTTTGAPVASTATGAPQAAAASSSSAPAAVPPVSSDQTVVAGPAVAPELLPAAPVAPQPEPLTAPAAAARGASKDPRKLNAKALRNVLRTIMVWMSWIHEDVGHTMAAFVYNPVHTPMFVPADGVGVPVVPYSFAAAAYRNFVFVERAKLVDAPPPFWFNRKICNKYMMFWKTCSKDVNDRKCYKAFQAGLQELAQQPAFGGCETAGLHSCVNRTETSASS